MGRLMRAQISPQRPARMGPRLIVLLLLASHGPGSVLRAEWSGSRPVSHPQSTAFVLATIPGALPRHGRRAKAERRALGCHGVAFSEEGKLLAWGNTKHVLVWDVANHRLVYATAPQDHAFGYAITFVPNRRSMAVCTIPSPDSQVLLLDPASGVTISSFPSHGLCLSIAASPDGRYLAYSSGFPIPSSVTVRDLESGASVHVRLALLSVVTNLAFSPDGLLLAADLAGSLSIRVLAVPSGRVMRRLGPADPSADCISISPDGRLLAATRLDGAIDLWEVKSGERLPPLVGHKGPVESLAFARPEDTLASGGRDKTIRLWNPDTGKAIGVLKGHCGAIQSLAVSPDGMTLASLSRDGTVRLWDLARGKQESVIDAATGKAEPETGLAQCQ